MIKVTVLYPNAEGKTFNLDYYLNKHVPLVDELSELCFKVQKSQRGWDPQHLVHLRPLL